jgi:hypothetical protein
MEFFLKKKIFDIVIKLAQQVNLETSRPESLPNIDLKLICMRVTLM